MSSVISTAMLSGAIMNGLHRYAMKDDLEGRTKEYPMAVRKAYIVSDALNLKIKEQVLVYARRELNRATLPVWWNVLKKRNVYIDYDLVKTIDDIAEISYLSRHEKFGKYIENAGESDAELRIYLDSYMDDDELWEDAEAFSNFAKIFPYAYYSGLYSEKERAKMLDLAREKLKENKKVEDWVRFVLTGELKYLRGRYYQLQDYRYWFVIF